jgi:hypothetical protein
MQLTTNTRAFVEAEQYSSFILLNLHDGLLPESFYRNVTDFGSGDTLHIKTVGSVTIQEAAEDTPLVYNPIETGEITMSITDYVGDAWYVTDDLREDGTDIDRLMAERSAESTRALQEHFETRFFEVCEGSQTDANANLVNGFPHRIASAVTTVGHENTFSLDHLIAMRLAFQKANVPDDGNVFICDGTVEATLNSLVTITHDVTPFGEALLKEGMSRGMQFVMNLFGWNIITSNRLATGTFGDGTTTITTTGIANVFMNVLDDQTKPIMQAWRRMPKAEGERNKDRARDEFLTRSKYGFGTQRLDTLGILITDGAKY